MSNTTPVASNPVPAGLTPEAVIAQFRTIRSQIDDVAPLSKGQRKLINQRLRRQPKAVVEASINVLGVLDNVSQAIGQPLDAVRQLQDESLRWAAMADEARAFLKGIEGASLIRHQRSRSSECKRTPSGRSWRRTRKTRYSCRTLRRSNG